MSDKLSVHLWGMSANAEGQLAIGATIVIVVVVALVALIKRRAKPYVATRAAPSGGSWPPQAKLPRLPTPATAAGCKSTPRHSPRSGR